MNKWLWRVAMLATAFSACLGTHLATGSLNVLAFLYIAALSVLLVVSLRGWLEQRRQIASVNKFFEELEKSMKGS